MSEEFRLAECHTGVARRRVHGDGEAAEDHHSGAPSVGCSISSERHARQYTRRASNLASSVSRIAYTPTASPSRTARTQSTQVVFPPVASYTPCNACAAVVSITVPSVESRSRLRVSESVMGLGLPVL